MSAAITLLSFALDDWRYALHLCAVETVIRSVEITPLPKAPGIVSGVINMQGRIIPVLNMRKRFRLPQRETRLSDELIIARIPRRAVAILVDAVTAVIDCARSDIVASEAILAGAEYIEGVVKLNDGMILIHDLDRFLSLDEERTLEDAIDHA